MTVVKRSDLYLEFLEAKTQLGSLRGFAPLWLPDFLFDFQRLLVEWAVRKGNAAIFADCGLGKTPMQLVWAENVVRKENKRVLIVTPLAVSHQTLREGEKFGVECKRSADGRPAGKITVTNYERLHLFDSNDYVGMVCDESSILKNFDGVRRGIVTEFMRRLPYRLCCTATAAPNDYMELGTTSEALGELGHMDMLARFFRNENNNATDTRGHWRGFTAPHQYVQRQWRFKRHAVPPFWRWVCSWARALRRPADLGYEDNGFVLPKLTERVSVIDFAPRPVAGSQRTLVPELAVTLAEQRRERGGSLRERCEKVAGLVDGRKDPAVVWCHLNEEGDLLEKLIPDAVQIAGKDSDERKEEVFIGFAAGDIRVLITKPKIGGFGLNWQHCAHATFFPSHSFEQYYQAVRRCWRFGQTRPVVVDVVTTPGERIVLENLQRKAKAADVMFSEFVRYMREASRIGHVTEFSVTQSVPPWLEGTSYAGG